ISHSVAVINLNSGTVTVPRFDRSLGALDSVNIHITDGTTTGTVAVENLGSVVTFAYAAILPTESFSVNGTSVGWASAYGLIANFSPAGYDGQTDFMGSSGAIVSPSGTFASAFGQVFDNTPFVGSGNVDLELTGDLAVSMLGGPDLAAEVDVDLGGGTI